MKCMKCGTRKITKFYKNYCQSCSMKEKKVNKLVSINKVSVSKVLQTGACHLCGGQMDMLSGQYGIFYKCQKRSCNATKGEFGKVKEKPNSEMQKILDTLDNRKKDMKKRQRLV